MEITINEKQWTLPCQTCGRERVFKRKGAYTQALKANNFECYQCAITHRRLKKIERLTVYERSCPSCNMIIKYNCRSHLDRAVQENSLCRSCFIQSVKIYANDEERRKHWNEANKAKVYESNRKRQLQTFQLRREGDLTTIMKLRLYKLKSRARIKNIPFSLGINDLVDCYRRQEGKCYYSGIPLSLILEGNGNITSNPYQVTVDRIDSTKGYERDNIVLCCMVANSAKSVLSSGEFFSFVEKMYHTMKTRINLPPAAA